MHSNQEDKKIEDTIIIEKFKNLQAKVYWNIVFYCLTLGIFYNIIIVMPLWIITNTFIENFYLKCFLGVLSQVLVWGFSYILSLVIVNLEFNTPSNRIITENYKNLKK